MDNWKLGKPFAIVVCPLYQFPSRRSQIYAQAIARDVCLLSFAHIAVLVAYGQQRGNEAAQSLLGSVLSAVSSMLPTTAALDYWQGINRVFLQSDDVVGDLWSSEKLANLGAIAFAKREGQEYLAGARAALMELSRDEAIARLIRVEKLDGKIRTIGLTRDNGLFDLS